MLRCCREDPGILGRGDSSRFSSFRGSGRGGGPGHSLSGTSWPLQALSRERGPVSTVSGEAPGLPLSSHPAPGHPLQKTEAHIQVPRWIPEAPLRPSAGAILTDTGPLFSAIHTFPSLPDPSSKPSFKQVLTACPRASS